MKKHVIAAALMAMTGGAGLPPFGQPNMVDPSSAMMMMMNLYIFLFNFKLENELIISF